MKKMDIKQFSKNFLYDFVGCVVMALAVKIFLAPSNIAPGGVTGIAILVNYLTPLSIGIVTLFLNIPLLILAYQKLGKAFTLKTAQTIIIYFIVYDYLLPNPGIYEGDAMLAALFGGILTGLGASLVFMHGSTAGGTDILTKLIRQKRPHITIGQISLSTNAIVMISAAFIYQNIEAALYGLIMSFTSSRVIDTVLYGGDTGKSLMIVTRKPDEMSAAIISRIHRSSTILHGKGAYMKDDTWVLMCVVRKQEFHPLKNLIREIDPLAFIIVSEAHEIIGAGFKAIDKEST